MMFSAHTASFFMAAMTSSAGMLMSEPPAFRVLSQAFITAF